MTNGPTQAAVNQDTIFLERYKLDLQAERLVGPDGHIVELRPKAFAVLRILALNAGRLMSKDELMAQVWPDVVVGEDSLVQAVREVRRALGEDGANIISTVRGRGYLMPEEAISTAGADAPSVRSGVRPKFRLIAMLGLIAVVLAGFGYWGLRKPPVQATARGPFPTVAVLRLRGFESGAEHDTFAAGFSDDLITTLARASHIRVISAASSFLLDPAEQSLQQIGSSLNSHYLVDGRVGVQGEKLHVQIRLNSAGDGEVVWAFDEAIELAALPGVYDELMRKIAGSVDANLYASETKHFLSQGTEDVTAYSLALRTLGRKGRFHPVEYRQGRLEAERAVERDPEFGNAWIYLGYLNLLDAILGITGEKTWKDFDAIEKTLQRGINLSPGNPWGWLGMASLRAVQEKPEETLKLTREALLVAPNNPEALVLMGKALMSLDRADDAGKYFEMADKLFPIRPPYYNLFVSRYHWLQGDLDTAIQYANACLAQAPHFATCWIEKIVALTEAGRADEVRETGAKMREVVPRSGMPLFRATFTTVPALLKRRERAASLAGF